MNGEVDELHPIDFRDIWGLTNVQAALELRLSERTMIAYAAAPNTTYYRKPSPRTKGLAAERHNSKIRSGQQPKKLALGNALK